MRDFPLVTCERLAVDFGEFRALDDVTLSFADKGVTGLIGVNGAGKTTLIHSLIGLIPRSEGHVAVADGVNVIGYCPDTPAFEPWLSAPEVLLQSVALTGLAQPEQSDVLAALETVGLGEVGNRRVGGFSRGMKQRLGVAAALILKPRLLFLDEPTSALDPIGRDEMLELISELGKELHVVFSSHLLGDVEQVVDSLVVVHRGQIRYEGPLGPFLGTADPTIEIDVSINPQRLVDRLKGTGVPAHPAEGSSNTVLVPATAKRALFEALSTSAEEIESIRTRNNSLQSAFRSAIEIKEFSNA